MWHLIWGWYGQVWPNIAASLLCAAWLDARNEIRHQEALRGRRALPRPRWLPGRRASR